jgi:hypothetical protein
MKALVFKSACEVEVEDREILLALDLQLAITPTRRW